MALLWDLGLWDLVCEWLVKFAYKRGCKNLEVGFGLQNNSDFGLVGKISL
ncbi:hypothetical protein [Helicobacter pullorum]|nr:hypothetical protein [Helicobacter pullorum]